MIETLFRNPLVRKRMVASHLGIILQEFALDLRESGYALLTIQSYCQGVEHFARWLKGRKIPVNEINRDHLERFLRRHLPRCRCSKPAVVSITACQPGINRLYDYLERRELLKAPPEVPPSEIDQIVNEYDEHLKGIHGLADSTRHARRRCARDFLGWRFRERRPSWSQIQSRDIPRFFSWRTKHWKLASARAIAVDLRSFLRFLEFSQRVESGLPASVPQPAPWPLSQPPITLSTKETKRFLACFDRRTPTGKRDYAIAMCCLELGLRACEIAPLEIDDVDWKSMTLHLPKTKGGSPRLLPLPAKLAKSLADYLRHGRPVTQSRSLFVRQRFPVGQPLKTHHVRSAIRLGLARSGIAYTGTHILRHTWASEALRRGATLKGIADILGHGCLDTTLRYAHVNLEELRGASLPWPKGAR